MYLRSVVRCIDVPSRGVVEQKGDSEYLYEATDRLRPSEHAARLQYSTAFLSSCLRASVYFSYAPVKSFLVKSEFPSAFSRLASEDCPLLDMAVGGQKWPAPVRS